MHTIKNKKGATKMISLMRNMTIHVRKIHTNPLSPLLSVGVRREDKNRWERRVPLVPDQIERLVREYGVKVLVQPSTRRVYPDSKYNKYQLH